MTHRTRIATVSGLLMTLLLLACAPGFGYDANGTPLPIQAWQCPTPSPQPTRILGYEPTATVTISTTLDMTTTPQPIYSTPLPTATPYVRSGSDYFMQQRITLGPLTLQVTGYERQGGPHPGTVLHLVTVQLDNAGQSAIPLMLDVGQLRAIKGSDGRTVTGDWMHDMEAAQQQGISPDRDPALREENGQIVGGYPPGRTTRTLVYVTPDGEAQSWGITLRDSDERRAEGSGSAQVWVQLRNDPHCQGAPGGVAQHQTPIPAPGVPRVGAGGWPVPPDTPISRGYGCHSYFTGVRGAGCPADAPWWHDGIDFAGPPGTPLFATSSMTILFGGADTSPMQCSWITGSQFPHAGFGLYLTTQDAAGYVYWYGHTSRLLKTSGTAAAGEEIAQMGSTGCSTGSHLHFRVRINGVDRNPLEVISR